MESLSTRLCDAQLSTRLFILSLEKKQIRGKLVDLFGSFELKFSFYSPRRTSMTMENPPFEAVFPIGNGDFPASHVSFQGCNAAYP